MIKFFRHIRKDLMETGKTSKYFKYAIGEIVLVVIGILIALQINNWNENRKERLEEQELLTQLESEFQTNLNQLDDKIALRNTILSASLKLLHYIDNPKERHNDSIIKYIGFSVITPTFDPIINDIISSGRVQLLQNKNLKDRLSRWTSEIIQGTEEEKLWVNYVSNYYAPLLLENNLYRSLISHGLKSNITGFFHIDKGVKTTLNLGDSKREVNFSEFLNNSQFESHIAQCAYTTSYINSQALSLRKRLVEIIDLIKEDIE